MAQYSDGLIITVSGSVIVKAAWEALTALGASDPFFLEAPLRFDPSGGTGVALAHSLAQGRISWELDSGSPDPGGTNTVTGASTFNKSSGVAEGGTSTTLTDDEAVWTPGEHVGDWVLLRPGVSEEWRRIASNTATVLTVENVWDTNPVATDNYGIYSELSVVMTGFTKGTPQDFVTAGITVAHWFAADGNTVAFQIGGSIAARSFSLSAPYTATRRGVPYAIHRDFTSRGYPLIQPGDLQASALVSRAIQAISDDLDGGSPPEAWHVFGDPSEPAFQNSWANGAPTGRFHKDGVRVHLAGVITNGALPARPHAITDVLPAGYRPAIKVTFEIGGNIVSVDTDGSFDLESGSDTSMDLAQISYRAE